MSTDILISIDPGTDMGFSAWVNKELYHSTHLDGTTSIYLAMLMEKIFKKISREFEPDIGEKTALIEDGFVGPNKKSALMLAQKRGLCQAVFERFSFDKIKLIYPSTWQNGLFKDKKEGGVKKASIDLACKITSTNKINTNTADAICMAFYYLNHDKV